MRRTKILVAALAVAATGIVPAGPVLASTAGLDAPGQDVTTIVCPDAGAVCDAAARVRTLLAPVQPVLDLLGPAVAPLSAGTGDVLAVLGSGSGFSAQGAADAASALLGQLDALTGTVAGLLGSAGIDPAPIQSALTQLRDRALEAIAPVLPVPAPAPAPAPEPGPAPAPDGGGSASPSPSSSGGARSTATNSGNPSGFVGPVSITGGTPLPVPQAPHGGTFTLAPLGLPEFAVGDAPFEAAALDTDLPAVDDVARPVLEAVNAAADRSGEDKATAVIIALSALLLAAGLLLDQYRKARQPFQLVD